MTIIIEDGTGVLSANSYVTEAELTDYATLRGITLTATPESLLHRAMDYVELQSYQGAKTNADQSLQWPRTGVYIDGTLQASDSIPDLVKELQIRVAIDIDAGQDPNAASSQAVKSETVVGAVSVTYQDNTTASTTSRQTQNILSKLLGGGSQWQFSVSRG